MKSEMERNTMSGQEEKIARKIASRLVGLQVKWAYFMGRTFGTLSTHMQKVMIIFFFIGAICWNIRLILKDPTRSSLQGILGKRQTIRHLPPLVKKNKSTDSSIIQRTEDFLLWFDTLSNTPKGMLEKNRILHERPGLIDSARQLIYQHKHNDVN